MPVIKQLFGGEDRKFGAVRTGDDAPRDFFFDGKSVFAFFPESKQYTMIAAPGDIRAALDAAMDKLHVALPLADFFADSPESSLLSRLVGGWQVGTANIDGVMCRHLFFVGRGGIELELWVENNDAAVPRRLIVTYRLLPGQPSLIAEFADWDTGIHPSEAEFAFQPPAGAKRIEPVSTPALGPEGSNR